MYTTFVEALCRPSEGGLAKRAKQSRYPHSALSKSDLWYAQKIRVADDDVVRAAVASRSQSAPHMHVPVCICSNVLQFETIPYGYICFVSVLALEPVLLALRTFMVQYRIGAQRRARSVHQSGGGGRPSPPSNASRGMGRGFGGPWPTNDRTGSSRRQCG